EGAAPAAAQTVDAARDPRQTRHTREGVGPRPVTARPGGPARRRRLLPGCADGRARDARLLAQLLELVAQVQRRLMAPPGVLLQAAPDDPAEQVRETAPQLD